MIDSLNRGDAVAASAAGAPPALLMTASRRPWASTVGVHHRGGLVGVPDVGRDEGGGAATGAGQVVGLGPAAGDDVGTPVEEPLHQHPADAPAPAGDDHHPARVVQDVVLRCGLHGVRPYRGAVSADDGAGAAYRRRSC